MAFGMRNAPGTFQRLMQLVLGDVPHCNVYLDDVVVCSDTWADHLATFDGVPVAEPFITQGICGQITDLQAGKLPQELIEGHPGLGKLEAIS
jgi:hypothetical protein